LPLFTRQHVIGAKHVLNAVIIVNQRAKGSTTAECEGTVLIVIDGNSLGGSAGDSHHCWSLLRIRDSCRRKHRQRSKCERCPFHILPSIMRSDDKITIREADGK
jgi:hypothetical protein